MNTLFQYGFVKTAKFSENYLRLVREAAKKEVPRSTQAAAKAQESVVDYKNFFQPHSSGTHEQWAKR
jgi:hypothetical protein